MIGIKLNYPAAGIDERLALAETAIQPDDLAVPTGAGEADGLMTHEDKAKLDALTLAALQATALSF
jgi:hypothetical protein